MCVMKWLMTDFPLLGLVSPLLTLRLCHGTLDSKVRIPHNHRLNNYVALNPFNKDDKKLVHGLTPPLVASAL